MGRTEQIKQNKRDPTPASKERMTEGEVTGGGGTSSDSDGNRPWASACRPWAPLARGLFPFIHTAALCSLADEETLVTC